MNNDQSKSTNYRPRSPNLSGFQAPPPPRLSRLPSIPSQSDSGFPQGYSLQHRGSYDATAYFSPSDTQQTSYFGSQSYQTYPDHSSSPYFSQVNPFQPVQDDMARLRGRPQVNYSEDAYPVNEFDEQITAQQRIPLQPQSISTTMPDPNAFSQFPAQPVAAVPPQQQSQRPAQQSSLLPHIDVKTKFPVARIKRIMQTDEDIGKVAQATPTAVAKALELFMIALVSKGAQSATEQGSKRVTATHLKNALLSDPQFDFLNEICENTPDEGAKKSRGKSEAKSDSDDEDIAGAGALKKKKGGKRKKAAGGDDSD